MVFTSVAAQAQAQAQAQYLLFHRKQAQGSIFFLFLVVSFLLLAFAQQQVKTKYRAGQWKYWIQITPHLNTARSPRHRLKLVFASNSIFIWFILIACLCVASENLRQLCLTILTTMVEESNPIFRWGSYREGCLTRFTNGKNRGSWIMDMKVSLACVAADSFPFSGGEEIEQTNEKRASEGARLGWARKLGRSREGVSKKGGGGGEERNVASPPPPTAYFATLRSFPPVRERLEKERKRLLRRLKFRFPE